MELQLRNHCSNEFLPGCEATAVEIDAALLASVRRRADAFRLIRVEMRTCGFNWLTGEAAEQALVRSLEAEAGPSAEGA